jgi:hypothetical protein
MGRLCAPTGGASGARTGLPYDQLLERMIELSLNAEEKLK